MHCPNVLHFNAPYDRWVLGKQRVTIGLRPRTLFSRVGRSLVSSAPFNCFFWSGQLIGSQSLKAFLFFSLSFTSAEEGSEVGRPKLSKDPSGLTNERGVPAAFVRERRAECSAIWMYLIRSAAVSEQTTHINSGSHLYDVRVRIFFYPLLLQTLSYSTGPD